MLHWLENEIGTLARNVIDGNHFLSDLASTIAINKAVNATRNRPHPWSTFADYPTWQGLTDRTYLARHLPAKYPDAAKPFPDPKVVGSLFQRRAGPVRMSSKSTCLFPAFAQYLTDGFLRTDPTNWSRTTSNHEIDMCPLYGRTALQTIALRLGSNQAGCKGRLKSQFIGVEEFPPFLFNPDGTLTDPAFLNLDPPLFAPNQPIKPPGAPMPPLPMTPAGPPPPTPDQIWDPSRLASLFAVGGDRANSSPFTAMMNTLWLREHNRIAGELEARNPSWDDERVFQIARNIIIPMFIKIVVEEYINHITPLPFNIAAVPSVAWTANWNRPNWMTVEFSLLYRWHGLMPDEVAWPGGAIPLPEFTLDNRRLLDIGLDGAITAASGQPAAELGVFNTADLLLPIESLSLVQSRFNHIASYNDYRIAFGLAPTTDFAQISSDPAVQDKLQSLYGSVDRVEFYPGLLSENRVKDSPLPELLMTMVAVDAFSQALTNPLLSAHIWGDPDTRALTFSNWGFDLIANTSSLADILTRQGRPAGAPPATMTQPSWRFGYDGP
jgi:prostaglandin-endoperoxide synthase 2